MGSRRLYGIVLGLAVIMVVPAWLAAPLADPAPIFMTAGVIAGSPAGGS
ncbi:hypothetical protein ABZX77_08095 [Streptomyces sp. NPDC004237]